MTVHSIITGYIDPTTISTYLMVLIPIIGVVLVALVSIIGLAVVIAGTTILVIFLKAKRKAAKALHIDENANKEVEDELIINTDNKE